MKKAKSIALTLCGFALISAINVNAEVNMKAVQENLNVLGYDCGTPDGIAGAKTKEAIHSYQKEHGIEESDDVSEELFEIISKETKDKQIASIVIPDDWELKIEDDAYIKGYLTYRDNAFNGALTGGCYYVLGEMTNISDEPVAMYISYIEYDENGNESIWGADSHYCLMPGKTELISISLEYPADNCEIGYELEYASQNYIEQYESLTIQSQKNSNGSVNYSINAKDGLNGTANIFYYDSDNHIVATDHCSFASAVGYAWQDTFDSPHEAYETYKICYTEY